MDTKPCDPMKRKLDDIARLHQQKKEPRLVFLLKIVCGLFMTYEKVDYLKIGLFRSMFFLPAINFRYDYLTWLKPLPGPMRNRLIYLLLFSVASISLGVFFKWSARFLL